MPLVTLFNASFMPPATLPEVCQGRPVVPVEIIAGSRQARNRLISGPQPMALSPEGTGCASQALNLRHFIPMYLLPVR